MDQEPDLIKEQMAETRVSLTDKIEKLEDTLKETVQETLHTASNTVENVTESVEQTVETVKEAVGDSVETVKETMHETVESVKDALNLRRHVQRHPWAMLGGAIAVGFLGGRLLGQAQRARERRRPQREESRFIRPGTPEAHAPMPTSAPARSPERQAESEYPADDQQSSLLGRLGETFGDELSKLKGLALGATFGVLRDMLTASVPEQMKPQLTEVMNGFTTKLGGKVIQGPLLDTQHDGAHENEGQNGHWHETETGRPVAARSSG